MSIPTLIEIKNFTKIYKNKVITIPDIAIKSKVTLLIGKNGSGKSTILKAIAGMIKYKGTISTIKSISYMPENPSFPNEITLNQFLYNLYQIDDIDYDYKGLLTKFSLKSKIDEYINALSKGMKAKLNLIQCLMAQKEVYLLDEPLSGLDEKSVQLLVEYIHKTDKVFIISSHLEEAFEKLDSEVIYFD